MTPSEQHHRDQRHERTVARAADENRPHPHSCTCRGCGELQIDRSDRW